MGDFAYLQVRRVSQWLSRFRKFRVMLDGKRIGVIKNGATQQFEISAGEHELQVMIDWVSSEPVAFECRGGDQVRFVCGHPDPTFLSALVPKNLVSSIKLGREDAEAGPQA